MAMSLGPLETQLLAYAQARKRQSVAAGEFVSALGWNVVQERKVLSRLAQKGLITRVRPGLYLVPPRLPPGGRWSPGEFLALSTLMSDRGGRYQISGPNVFHRYGWTDQVPNRLYVYNNRISGDRQIGAVALTFIEVADQRLGGVEVVRIPDGIDVVYASKPRALVNAVYDWSRFDSLPRAFEWIRREVKKDDAFAAELIRLTVPFGNQGTVSPDRSTPRTRGGSGAAAPPARAGSSPILKFHSLDSEPRETRKIKPAVGSGHQR